MSDHPSKRGALKTDGYVIEPERYYSHERKRAEERRLWPRTWLLAGLESDVASAGDYFLFELGRQSVIVTRGDDGEVRAFHNVCMHRGQRLCLKRAGCVEKLTCGYHGWVWGLDGRLLVAPDAARVRGGVPKDRRTLREVHAVAWAGFVWVHFAEPETPFVEFIRPLDELIARYRPDAFVLVDDETAEWECNWKLALEAFSETYHITATHPHLLGIVDPLRTSVDYWDLHNRVEARVAETGANGPPTGEAGEITQQLARDYGLDPAELRGLDQQAMRGALIGAIRARSEERDVDLGLLTDDELIDSHQFFAFPNAHIDFHGGNRFSVFRYRPHPSDPERCFYDLWDFVRPSMFDMRLPTTRPAHRVLAPNETMLQTIQEDADLLKALQLNMHSWAYAGPLIHETEGRIEHMNRNFDRYLDDSGSP